jgi:hypothetical protein
MPAGTLISAASMMPEADAAVRRQQPMTSAAVTVAALVFMANLPAGLT